VDPVVELPLWAVPVDPVWDWSVPVLPLVWAETAATENAARAVERKSFFKIYLRYWINQRGCSSA
jgi:hypothetical protein